MRPTGRGTRGTLAMLSQPCPPAQGPLGPGSRAWQPEVSRGSPLLRGEPLTRSPSSGVSLPFPWALGQDPACPVCPKVCVVPANMPGQPPQDLPGPTPHHELCRTASTKCGSHWSVCSPASYSASLPSSEKPSACTVLQGTHRLGAFCRQGLPRVTSRASRKLQGLEGALVGKARMASAGQGTCP